MLAVFVRVIIFSQKVKECQCHHDVRINNVSQEKNPHNSRNNFSGYLHQQSSFWNIEMLL